MRPNIDYIKQLQNEKGWSNAQLAIKMGVSKAHVGRIFSGKRDAGNKVISGIVKAFPNEPLDKLFILD
jgi:transcriptional regulator with XRE-family HTH domain